MNRLTLGLITGIIIVLGSCTFDNEEEIFPPEDGGNGCETSNMSYLTNVVPIIEFNCYACHGDDTFNSLGSNIHLEGYDNLKVYVDNGRFFGSINRDQGFSPMPRNSPKLDQCDLDQIKSWIDAGASNN